MTPHVAGKKNEQYHNFMQSCSMKGQEMSSIKTVGKSGQISIGKSLSGVEFLMEVLPGGDIMLKRAVVIPANEVWLHDPAMKKKIQDAEDWMKANPPRETTLDELENLLASTA